ncbi:MAG: S-layer homology domain-containing protein, partial [Oscillospiraceae bacterium]|nr:S-layer homology domain-containing protein [Oscillospiraceae bacterium]
MKKRIIAWILIAAFFVSVLPSMPAAAQTTEIEPVVEANTQGFLRSESSAIQVSSHEELSLAIVETAQPGVPVIIVLTKDISGPQITIPAGRDITLVGLEGGEQSKYTFAITTAQRHFLVQGATLTIGDGITLCGADVAGTGARGGVQLSAGAAFNLTGNAVIQNNIASAGGGVQVWDSTFTMYGGTISGNTAEHGGGGVSVRSGGSFVMHDGIISDNTASGNEGGGVQVWDSTFTMYGGIISGNTAKRFVDGGGVGVRANGLFTMHDGTIIDNTTGAHGGGVTVGRVSTGGFGTFIMNGGTISGNTAFHNGGGVMVAYSTFTMSGYATISDNEANAGGGVAVWSEANFEMWNSTFTMSDYATISGNMADFDGGGIAVLSEGNRWLGASTSTFTMEGGTINGNAAGGNGGGVALVTIPFFWAENIGNSNFTMHDGTIRNNTAVGDGGGIFTTAYPTDYRVPLLPDDYPNITIRPPAVFSGNRARIAVVPDPSAAVVDGIMFNSTSIFGHPLNNYDINFAPANLIQVTFQPGENGTLIDGTPDVVLYMALGTTLDALLIPGATPNTGWTHDGWNLHGDKVVPAECEVTADVTFVAVWAEEILTYTVLFDWAYTGVTVTRTGIAASTIAGTLDHGTAPARTGWTHTGWTLNGAPVNLTTHEVTADVTFVAVWTQDTQGGGNGGGNSGGNSGGGNGGGGSGGTVAPPTPQPPVLERQAYLIGKGDGLIHPQGNITRAEVATIFFRLITDEYRTEVWSQTNPFPDVALQNWFNNAVSTTTNANIFRGFPDG